MVFDLLFEPATRTRGGGWDFRGILIGEACNVAQCCATELRDVRAHLFLTHTRVAQARLSFASD